MSNRREILDASIRAFIAEGSGIDTSKVIPGLTSDDAPSGLYAEVHFLSEQRIGRNTGKQYVGSRQSFTVDDVLVESMYSVHFYRAGALNAAFDFADWAFSETGLNWASTAITDGRIKGANVYAGGSGYQRGDTCVFVPPAALAEGDETGEYATGSLVVSDSGELQHIAMRSFGEGYFDLPTIRTTGGGTGAIISPRGFGFDIKHPIQVRNLTGEIAGDYEERAQVDLRICHTRNFKDVHSGRVEEIRGPASGIYQKKGGKLVYIYQTNLVPASTDTLTMVPSANRASIAIPRIAEWSKAGTIDATGMGITTLLDTQAIVPQYGRDLIGTSPFISNYEGHLICAFSGVDTGAINSFNAGFFVRTTHMIAGMPNNIVSTRAISKPVVITSSNVSAGIALSEFNSMVLLDSDIANGGTIGLKIEVGCMMLNSIAEANIDDLLKQLNTGATITHTPVANLTFVLNGFSTRATFLQHDLA